MWKEIKKEGGGGIKDFFDVCLSQCLRIFVIKIMNIWHKSAPKQIPLIGLKIPK